MKHWRQHSKQNKMENIEMSKLMMMALATVLATALFGNVNAEARNCEVIPDITLRSAGAHVKIVLPIKGSGVADVHIGMNTADARKGADNKRTAMCPVEGSEGEFDVTYRARFSNGTATVKVASAALSGGARIPVRVFAGGLQFYGVIDPASRQAIMYNGKTQDLTWSQGQ